MPTHSPTPRQSLKATTTDLHRDGSNLESGAWIYKEFTVSGETRRMPITVTYDNGSLYEYVMGHVSLNSSNNRSGLFYNKS
jgi:hypothetical protein